MKFKSIFNKGNKICEHASEREGVGNYRRARWCEDEETQRAVEQKANTKHPLSYSYSCVRCYNNVHLDKREKTEKWNIVFMCVVDGNATRQREGKGWRKRGKENGNNC